MRLRAIIISILLVSGPLMLLARCPASSATPIYVSGDIYSTTSWSLATSPVYIVGNVTVHEGVVLNIKEGTEVLFDGGTHISVEGGTLVIAGTFAAPVRFLPNSSSPWKGFYEWIHVSSTAMFNASVSASWAELSFGVKGFYLDGVQNARFDNVKFNDTAEAGIYLSQCSDVWVRNCTFTDSDGWGLMAEFSNNLTFSDNIFSGCTASSVLLSDCEHSSATSSTVMAGSSEKGVCLVSSAHILVDGLVIEDAITGLELENSGFNTVFSCVFSKDGVGLLLNASSDNLFRGNDFAGCDIPLSFVGGLELVSNSFELSNLVDGLPVRALSKGDLDGVSAGAVVLLNCAGSVVSNITFPARGGAMIVLFGGGNTLRDFSLGGSAAGIVVVGSNEILIENVSVTGPGQSGITLWSTEGVGIRDCRVIGCEAGISFLGPMNITVTRTTLKNAIFDLVLSDQAVVRALDCTFANASVDAGSRLDEVYTLQVAVRDNASAPLSGADMMVINGVKILYASAHFGGGDPPSDAEGTFPALEATGTVHDGTSASPFDTTIEVWDGVHAFDWNPRILLLAAPASPVFSATESGLLAGMVRDPAGDPVEGVGLALGIGLNCSTGPDGTYMFPPLPPGTYALNASLSGWQSRTRPAVEISVGQTTYVNLTFDAAAGSIGEIRGVVTDTAGAPVLAAIIDLGGGRTAGTNESGVFSMQEAPGGWVNFTITKNGYLEAHGTAFVPPNGASRWANVTLVPVGGGGKGMVTGWVRDPANGNAPIAGALVWVEDLPGINNTTGAEGVFSLQGIPAGQHSIWASALDYQTGNITVDVVADLAKQVTIYLNQETMAWAVLNGHVYDQQGRPVNGATVRIDGTARMAGTGPDGGYRFDNAPTGNCSVTASAPLLGSTTETDVLIPEHMTITVDIILGPDRAFANTSLGVRVSGDFTGNGSLIIQAAAIPPHLPPGGIAVFFEIKAHEINFTKITINASPNMFKSTLDGLDHSKVDIHFCTHHGDEWEEGDTWEIINDSRYDTMTGYMYGNITRLSQFGVSVTSRHGPTGGTIVALPPWLSPVAVVAIVVLVGVPIGIIVIRMRQPPSGGDRQNAPVPPPPQSGANL